MQLSYDNESFFLIKNMQEKFLLKQNKIDEEYFLSIEYNMLDD